MNPAAEPTSATNGLRCPGPCGCWRRALPALALLIPLSLLWWTGLRAIGFGRHWDEGHQIGAVQRTLDSKVLLPGFYNYPSMSYWIALSALLPDVAAVVAERGVINPGLIMDAVRPGTETRGFHLRVRGFFLVFSSLAVVWVFLLARAMGRCWLEGWLAACLLACSWEWAYHIRWIAPDGPTAMFTAMAVWLMAEAARRPRAMVLPVLAAAAAGAACSSKYPAGVLLVPLAVLAVLLARRNGAKLKNAAARFAALAVVFVAAYLMITPGTVLEPVTFNDHVQYEVRHYRDGHFNYTVGRGLPNLVKTLRTMGLVHFSPWRIGAFAVALAAVAGAVHLVRRDRAGAAIFLAFPVVYVAYMATQRVLFERNLLVVMPFAAILAARGAGWAWEAAQEVRVRAAIGTACVVLLAANAGWLVWTSSQTRHRLDGDEAYIRRMASYLARHDGTAFLVSDRVARDLRRLGAPAMPNVTADAAAPAEMVVFYNRDDPQGAGIREWPTLKPGLFVTWFGPFEVNMDMYPTWMGDARPVVLRRADAERIGVRLVAPQRGPVEGAAQAIGVAGEEGQ